METCSGVRIHSTRRMKDGDREWSIPSSAFYAGRKHGQLQTTTNHYTATPLTRNLAEQLSAKLKLAGMEATVCDLFADSDTLIHETMVSIGEEAPPPAAPPTSLQELGKAIENCFRQGLSPLEVLNHCNKTVLLG